MKVMPAGVARAVPVDMKATSGDVIGDETVAMG